MERRTRLTMETLDERIVPSQGQTLTGPIPESVGLGSISVSIPAALDEVSLAAQRMEAGSGSASFDRHPARDLRDLDSPNHDTEDSATFDGNRDLRGLYPRSPSPDDFENRDPVPVKAINAWRENAMQRAAAETVEVDGSVGVAIHNDRICFVSTDAPHSTSPAIVFVGPLNEGETDAGSASPASAENENATIVRAEPVAPGVSTPKSETVAAPEVQPADTLARFVPFSPAALDGAVRRFLDDLKSDDAEGPSLGGKTAFWATVLVGSVFVGDLARRKKLPQKAIQFLSLSKYVTRTKTN